jgi:hypothetical protein
MGINLWGYPVNQAIFHQQVGYKLPVFVNYCCCFNEDSFHMIWEFGCSMSDLLMGKFRIYDDIIRQEQNQGLNLGNAGCLVYRKR